MEKYKKIKISRQIGTFILGFFFFLLTITALLLVVASVWAQENHHGHGDYDIYNYQYQWSVEEYARENCCKRNIKFKKNQKQIDQQINQMNKDLQDVKEWRKKELERLKKLTPRLVTMEDVENFKKSYENQKKPYKRYWWHY